MPCRVAPVQVARLCLVHGMNNELTLDRRQGSRWGHYIERGSASIGFDGLGTVAMSSLVETQKGNLRDQGQVSRSMPAPLGGVHKARARGVIPGPLSRMWTYRPVYPQGGDFIEVTCCRLYLSRRLPCRLLKAIQAGAGLG